MYQKSQREDDLFSGTKQKKDKKKDKQKDKDTPSTLPVATGVHQCHYDHSQQIMLVASSLEIVTFPASGNVQYRTNFLYNLHKETLPYTVQFPPVVVTCLYIFCKRQFRKCPFFFKW